ncbi:MAG: DeoR/GlpR transcriptional regulator, partial [Pirellulales bacterium]|nr:DeoR/GlpR transcriptional regulator [Pirellulales bacterium]
MSARNQRQESILELLARRGRLNVDDLADELGVTAMTIRRDLAAMEKTGVLTRTHGGCVLQSPFVRELPFSQKEQQHREQKYAIACAAVGMLKSGDRVYLDTGTTAVHVARV